MTVQTKEEVTKNFTADLKNLFNKYAFDTELEVEDNRITISIPGVYDKDGETIREFTQIDFGSSIWFPKK